MFCEPVKRFDFILHYLQNTQKKKQDKVWIQNGVAETKSINFLPESRT